MEFLEETAALVRADLEPLVAATERRWRGCWEELSDKKCTLRLFGGFGDVIGVTTSRTVPVGALFLRVAKLPRFLALPAITGDIDRQNFKTAVLNHLADTHKRTFDRRKTIMAVATGREISADDPETLVAALSGALGVLEGLIALCGRQFAAEKDIETLDMYMRAYRDGVVEGGDAALFEAARATWAPFVGVAAAAPLSEGDAEAFGLRATAARARKAAAAGLEMRLADLAAKIAALRKADAGEA